MNKFTAATILTLLLMFCFGAVAVSAQDYLPDLVRRVKPSAVAIETFDAKGATITRGSGFFVGGDKIITNRHVIEKSSRVEVHLMNGKKFVVRGVLAIDGEGDLALLQVNVPAGDAVPLPIVRAVPQEGESIVVIGNPYGLGRFGIQRHRFRRSGNSGLRKNYSNHRADLAGFERFAGRQYARSGDRRGDAASR